MSRPAKKIVHVVPKSVFSNEYHGSFKDVISRVRWFENSSAEYCQIRLSDDSPSEVELDSDPHTAYVIEYTFFPKTVAAIRKKNPDALIAVRCHNLEPLQHLDNHGLFGKKNPLWVCYGMLRLFRSEVRMKRLASVLWPISEWEGLSYWKRLPGSAQIQWLPYFCPDHLLPEQGIEDIDRNIIACMPTSQQNRKSTDLALRFFEFARKLQEANPNRYHCKITGDLSKWNIDRPKSVEFAGMLGDLRPFLRNVVAVCLLSKLGYGFKTTICDAIANGSFVIVHPRQAKRLPERIMPAVIPFDGNIDQVLRRLAEKRNIQSIDGILRRESEQILQHAFFSND